MLTLLLKWLHSPDPTLTGRLHLIKPRGNILHTIHYIYLMCRQNSPEPPHFLAVYKSLNIYYLVLADVLIVSLIWTGGRHRDTK